MPHDHDHVWGALGAGWSIFAMAGQPAILQALTGFFVAAIVPLAAVYIRERLRCKVERVASQSGCPMEGRIKALEAQSREVKS